MGFSSSSESVLGLGSCKIVLVLSEEESGLLPGTEGSSEAFAGSMDSADRASPGIGSGIFA